MVEIAHVEHVHHVVCGQKLDGGLLHLQLERSQVVGVREREEALQIALEDLLGNLLGIEGVDKPPHHFLLGHHGLQWGRLGGQDQAVAGKPGPLLAEDGEVSEVLLVVVLHHHGGIFEGVKRELGLGPEQ